MNEFDPMLGPGDVPAIVSARLFNPDKSPMQIISGEFEELNNKIVAPGQQLDISLMVPPGYREFIKQTKHKDKVYIYVGLIDKEAAAPLIHKPTL